MKRKKKSNVVSRFKIPVIVFGGIFLVLLLARPLPVKNQEFGVTFSYLQSAWLGSDWPKAYLAVLDELEVKSVRLPVYWSEVEPQKGTYDFSSIDWMVAEAEKRNVDVTLAVGQKVPRWPECFIPGWVDVTNEEAHKAALLEYLEVVVNRYDVSPAVTVWQVENEPFFSFGDCPPENKDLFLEEVALVRSIDKKRPVQTTTSGEQSLWMKYARNTDILGASLYRTVQAPVIGKLTFPLPPAAYRIQYRLARLFGAEVVISELQLEPWLAQRDGLSLEQHYEAFTVEDMQRHMRYANRVGIPHVYAWGAEWWYYMKQQGDERLWNEAYNRLHMWYGEEGI